MTAVEIIMVPVTDQQKAKEFYSKLGFTVVMEAPDGHGGSWLQMGLKDNSTTIALAKFQGIIFETDDIEREIALMKKQGIEVGSIDTMPWGKFAWLKDLDGNGLCLHQK